MGFYDTKTTPSPELIKYFGGWGKAFAHLGNAVSDVEEQKRLRSLQDEQMQMKKQEYQDGRNDRKEDVEYKNKVYKDSREDNAFNQNLNRAKFNLDERKTNADIEHNNAQLNLQEKKYNNDFINDKIKSEAYAKQVDYYTKPGVKEKVTTKEAPYGFNQDGSIKSAQQHGEELLKKRLEAKYGNLSEINID